MSLNSGALLSDRYRLLRLIATGGMGQVWEADDAVLDRQVAVKVLKPEFSSDAEFVERFRSEAKVTARISHPGIAAVYDYGQVPDPASGSPLSYLVMELVVGEPLSDVLSREGALPLRHTLDMLEQTGRALNAAHTIGLVHRDVKPGNILITPTGQVKLTDFGIAKSMGAAAVTQTGMIVGTAQYIAPEQAMGRDSTPAGDIYSLGVVGYECLSGRRPFIADSPVSIAMMHVRDVPPPLPDSVPTPVRQLIGSAMLKDPGARYPDGQAFADAVADVRAGHDPRPPSAFGAAPAMAGAAAATAATTVLPDESSGPASTRAYTRLQGASTRPSELPPTRRGPAVPPARTTRGPAPAPIPQRRGIGWGTWFVVAMLLLIGLLVAGAIALSNVGAFDRPTPQPRTTSAPSTTAQRPAPTQAPAPAPTPTRTPSSPAPAPIPTVPDLEDMLGSLTSSLSELVPPPAGNGGTDNSGNGTNGNGGNANAGNGRGVDRG